MSRSFIATQLWTLRPLGSLLKWVAVWLVFCGVITALLAVESIFLWSTGRLSGKAPPRNWLTQFEPLHDSEIAVGLASRRPDASGGRTKRKLVLFDLRNGSSTPLALGIGGPKRVVVEPDGMSFLVLCEPKRFCRVWLSFTGDAGALEGTSGAKSVELEFADHPVRVAFKTIEFNDRTYRVFCHQDDAASTNHLQAKSGQVAAGRVWDDGRYKIQLADRQDGACVRIVDAHPTGVLGLKDAAGKFVTWDGRGQVAAWDYETGLNRWRTKLKD